MIVVVVVVSGLSRDAVDVSLLALHPVTAIKTATAIPYFFMGRDSISLRRVAVGAPFHCDRVGRGAARPHDGRSPAGYEHASRPPNPSAARNTKRMKLGSERGKSKFQLVVPLEAQDWRTTMRGTGIPQR